MIIIDGQTEILAQALVGIKHVKAYFSDRQILDKYETLFHAVLSDKRERVNV